MFGAQHLPKATNIPQYARTKYLLHRDGLPADQILHVPKRYEVIQTAHCEPSALAVCPHTDAVGHVRGDCVDQCQLLLFKHVQECAYAMFNTSN